MAPPSATSGREFVMLCRGRLQLLNNLHVAIDGSKFKAVNNRDKSFSHRKIGRCADSGSSTASTDTLAELDQVLTRARSLPERECRVSKRGIGTRSRCEPRPDGAATGDIPSESGRSLSDPDARAMRHQLGSSGRRSPATTCRQAAVDAKHHMIVATHEVTS